MGARSGTVALQQCGELDIAVARLRASVPRGAIPIERVRRTPVSSAAGPNSIDTLAAVRWYPENELTLAFGHPIDDQDGSALFLRYKHVMGPGTSGSPILDANTGELVCVHQRASGEFGECTKLSSLFEAVSDTEGTRP